MAKGAAAAEDVLRGIYSEDKGEDEPLSVRWTRGWMPRLERSPGAVRIYVDMNHWIELSRARLSRPNAAAYDVPLRRLESLVDAGRIILVISAAHYQELDGITDPRQRADVALTMDRLGRYEVITERSVLIRIQLARALAEWQLMLRPELQSDELWGRGSGFAFGGGPAGMKLRGPYLAKVAMLAEGAPLITRIEKIAGHGWTFRDRDGTMTEKIEAAIWESSEFAVLRGPDDDDIAPLRAEHGYRPEVARDALNAIAEREAELSRILAKEPQWSHRLDDVVAARLWVWELNEPLEWAADRIGISRRLPFERGSKALLSRILQSMPMMAVEFALRRANWANGSYTWTKNDVLDLVHLGVAVPYAEVTWTEKHAAQVLNAAGIAKRFGRQIIARPRELLDVLDRIEGLDTGAG
jgi:hypothetical protein